MKFALFYEIPVARPWDRDSEHRAYKEIQDLTKKREEFVKARLKELGEDENTLDKVVVETVREQAGAKGYRFGAEK